MTTSLELSDLRFHGYRNKHVVKFKERSWPCLKKKDCLLETGNDQQFPVLKSDVFFSTIHISLLLLYTLSLYIITTAARGLCHLNINRCCFEALLLMLLFFLGIHPHVTIFYFISLFDLFLFRHFKSSIVFTFASMSELVCVNAWADSSSLCIHYICLSMGMKMGCIAFLPSTSPDVVYPCCLQWLHLYSIINGFWEDHTYSICNNMHTMLPFSFFLSSCSPQWKCCPWAC